MSTSSPLVEALKRPATIIGGCALILVVVVWFLAFFLPQGSRLSTLKAKEVSLQQAVNQDDAKIQTLRQESSHAAQIQAMYSSLTNYVPATPDIYTYVQVLSGAGNASGVTIANISPGTMAPFSGTSYSAIPITTSVQGTYDHLLQFIHAINTLSRLTDIDSVNLSGGGPGSNRASLISATFQMSIFTSAKPAAAG